MAILDRLRSRTQGEAEAEPDGESPEGRETPEVSTGNRGETRRRAEQRRQKAHQYAELKSRVHRKLFDHIDFTKLGQVSEARASQDIASLTRAMLREEEVLFNAEEQQTIVTEIQNEVFGLGPLEPLLRDDSVCDILVNKHDQIYVERGGVLELTPDRFLDDAHLMRIIERILSAVGRRVDESTPMVDARLADGSRVNVIVPPLALDGPCMSIRRFSEDALTAEKLVALGSVSAALVEVLQACVKARLNILISGGTGSGKTTILNMLSAFIPETERIVSIEDSAELQLHQDHVVRLETRPPNIEGKGQVSQRELVINSLRMRPDRIIIGEVRGSEALDMLQAMNTGHDGSLTTIHANTPADAVMRLETMVAMSGFELPPSTTRAQIGSAIDLILQVRRFPDGRRCVTSMREITGFDRDHVESHEIFGMVPDGVLDDGTPRLVLAPTGRSPKILERLRTYGIDLDVSLFEKKELISSEPARGATP
ncbi:MAG: CpaF family protein [Myxococcota bacterium]|jgi:pilus assembly protein CpaF|nr:CpaF family protein [Myxococcota bacterium]